MNENYMRKDNVHPMPEKVGPVNYQNGVRETAKYGQGVKAQPIGNGGVYSPTPDRVPNRIPFRPVTNIRKY